MTGTSTQGPKGIRLRPECVSSVLEAWKARLVRCGASNMPVTGRQGGALSRDSQSRTFRRAPRSNGGQGRGLRRRAMSRPCVAGVSRTRSRRQHAEMFDRDRQTSPALGAGRWSSGSHPLRRSPLRHPYARVCFAVSSAAFFGVTRRGCERTLSLTTAIAHARGLQIDRARSLAWSTQAERTWRRSN